MNRKHKKPKPRMDEEAAKRLVEEQTNEPHGRQLSETIMTFLQGEFQDPNEEAVNTMLYALERTKHTMLLVARTRGYAVPTGPLMEATRLVSEATLRVALAITETEPKAEPEPN